jgi:cofilin
MKLRNKYGYLMFKLENNNSVVLDKSAPADASYDQFLADLPSNEARYAITHVHYQLEDGSQRSKMIFFLWVPEYSNVKTKMLYASAKNLLKQSLNGITFVVEGQQLSDLQYEDIVARCLEKFR